MTIQEVPTIESTKQILENLIEKFEHFSIDNPYLYFIYQGNDAFYNGVYQFFDHGTKLDIDNGTVIADGIVIGKEDYSLDPVGESLRGSVSHLLSNYLFRIDRRDVENYETNINQMAELIHLVRNIESAMREGQNITIDQTNIDSFTSILRDGKGVATVNSMVNKGTFHPLTVLHLLEFANNAAKYKHPTMNVNFGSIEGRSVAFVEADGGDDFEIEKLTNKLPESVRGGGKISKNNLLNHIEGHLQSVQANGGNGHLLAIRDAIVNEGSFMIDRRNSKGNSFRYEVSAYGDNVTVTVGDSEKGSVGFSIELSLPEINS